MSSAFELLTSLRYDPYLCSVPWNTRRGDLPSPFFLLPFHLERLVSGAQALGWVGALEALGVETDDFKEGKIEGDAGVYVYADALKRFRALCQESVDNYVEGHPECSKNSDQALKIRITLSQGGVIHAAATPTPSRPYDLLAASTYDPAALTAVANAAGNGTALPPFASPPIRVLLDTQPTLPFNVQLMGPDLSPHKTTSRGAYDAARTRAGIPPLASTSSPLARPTEVLLHTPGSPALITDASIRTPFFYRGGRWVTPALPTPVEPAAHQSHDTAATTPLPSSNARTLAPLAGTVRRFLLAQGRAVEGDVPLGEVQVGEWVLLCNAVEGCVIGIVED